MQPFACAMPCGLQSPDVLLSVASHVRTVAVIPTQSVLHVSGIRCVMVECICPHCYRDIPSAGTYLCQYCELTRCMHRCRCTCPAAGYCGGDGSAASTTADIACVVLVVDELGLSIGFSTDSGVVSLVSWSSISSSLLGSSESGESLSESLVLSIIWFMLTESFLRTW